MHQSRGFDPAHRAVAGATGGRPGPRCSPTSSCAIGETARRRRRDHRRHVRADRARRVRRALPEPLLRRRHRRAARRDLGRGPGVGWPAPGRRGLRDVPQPRLRPGAARRRPAPAAGHRRARPGRHHRRRRPEPQRHVGSRHARCRARPADRRAARRGDAAGSARARRSSWADGPTVRALPEDAAGPTTSPPAAARSAASTCWPSRTVRRDVDVLVVAVGRARSRRAGGRRRRCAEAGFTVRVVDPRWVTPVDPASWSSWPAAPRWS